MLGEDTLKIASGGNAHMVVNLLRRLHVKAIAEDKRSLETHRRTVIVIAILEQNRRLAVVNVLLELPAVPGLITTRDVLQRMRGLDVLNCGTHIV